MTHVQDVRLDTPQHKRGQHRVEPRQLRGVEARGARGAGDRGGGVALHVLGGWGWLGSVGVGLGWLELAGADETYCSKIKSTSEATSSMSSNQINHIINQYRPTLLNHSWNESWESKSCGMIKCKRAQSSVRLF
jgi:hypothetical protein